MIWNKILLRKRSKKPLNVAYFFCNWNLCKISFIQEEWFQQESVGVDQMKNVYASLGKEDNFFFIKLPVSPGRARSKFVQNFLHSERIVSATKVWSTTNEKCLCLCWEEEEFPVSPSGIRSSTNVGTATIQFVIVSFSVKPIKHLSRSLLQIARERKCMQINLWFFDSSLVDGEDRTQHEMIKNFCNNTRMRGNGLGWIKASLRETKTSGTRTNLTVMKNNTKKDEGLCRFKMSSWNPPSSHGSEQAVILTFISIIPATEEFLFQHQT